MVPSAAHPGERLAAGRRERVKNWGPLAFKDSGSATGRRIAPLSRAFMLCYKGARGREMHAGTMGDVDKDGRCREARLRRNTAL